MAGIPYRTRNLLCWDSFQGRGGKPKRPFFIFWPVQVYCAAAPAGGRDRKSLEELVLWARSIHYLKRVLASVKNLTELSRDKFSDKEVGQFLYRVTTRDITWTDFFLTSLLNYFHVTAPVEKVNPLNVLIEEVLKRNKARLEGKGVHLFKKLEGGLPEITIPEEPLTYILNSVLQYVILSTPPGGNVELVTASFVSQKEGAGIQPFFERYGGYVEISVIFPDQREAARQSEASRERIPTPPKGEVLDLMLRLVKGTVLENRGKMDFDRDEKKGQTKISLRFPLERRKVFFGEPRRIYPSPHPPS